LWTAPFCCKRSILQLFLSLPWTVKRRTRILQFQVPTSELVHGKLTVTDIPMYWFPPFSFALGCQNKQLRSSIIYSERKHVDNENRILFGYCYHDSRVNHSRPRFFKQNGKAKCLSTFFVFYASSMCS
jgi:hypothetical protein